MGLTVDLSLLLVWVLVVFLAARRGFFAVALQLGAWVVSIALSGTLSAMLAQLLYDSFGRGMALRFIEENIGQAVQGSQAAQRAQEMIAQLPQALERLAQLAGISTQGLIENLKARQFSAADAAQVLEESIVAPIAIAAIRILLRLALFAALLFVTRLICRQVAKLGKLPVLKQADRLLGAVLGLLKGALLLFVLSLLLRAAAALHLGGPEFESAIENSAIVGALEWIRL